MHETNLLFLWIISVATKLSSIQYAYALNEQGILTHITDSLRTSTYSCPGCKSALTPVLGKVKTKHYRHSQSNCTLESYLHKSAKIALFYHYKQALNGKKSAVLELERTIHCNSTKAQMLAGLPHECKKIVPARYNLTALFNGAVLEKRDPDTGFIPDVMLFHSEVNQRLYIEICVTHPCTPEKIDTGIPILEFKIASEEDIKMLLSGLYSVHDERITLYNFRVLSDKVNTCTAPCTVDGTTVSIWSLSESGRLNERIAPLKDVCERTYTELNVWPTSLPVVQQVVNLRRLLKYTDPQSYYPNCLLCPHSSDWKDGYLMCSSKHKWVPYTEARQCADYEVNQ